LESRKYYLQKQIIEALEANDSDLYSLLKSQWAHRFGVESLEELNNLDINQLNRNPNNLNNQKIDQSQENSFEGDEAIYMTDDDTEEKEIKTKEIEPVKDENYESFKIKSYKIKDKGNDENEAINPVKENKNQAKVKDLIPLPPKPRYGFLKKWLLRS
tara:strand:+ start:297 stop:770 length:474 start_codon:yes stop_codon:yes gene_type:complete